MKKSTKGFTLIELLVVLAVVGLLASIVLVWLADTRAKARDGKRVSEIDTLRTAMELYYTDHDKYPEATEADWVKLEEDTDVSEALKKWLPVMPRDPLYGQDKYNDPEKPFSYRYKTNETAAEYKLCVELETRDLYCAYSSGGEEIVYGETPISFEAAMFAGSGKNLYRCLTSTGCDTDSDWVAVFTPSKGVAVTDFAIDSINHFIYSVTYSTTLDNTIERCLLSTDCGASADWTISLNTGSVYFNSIVFDPVNGVLYAGGRFGRIYRCDVSTGCDGGAADWSIVLETGDVRIQDIILDSNNNVLYANSLLTFNGGSVIYRCPTLTGCDSSEKWTPTFDGTGANYSFWEIAFDPAYSVIYGAGFDFAGGKLARCDVALTSCDAHDDWTIPYIRDYTNFVSVTVADGVLYIGEHTISRINKCLLSSGCDEQADFSGYSLGSGTYMYAIGYDYDSSVVYAGTGEYAHIYRCPAPSGCDSNADWTLAANKPDEDDCFFKFIYSPSP